MKNSMIMAVGASLIIFAASQVNAAPVAKTSNDMKTTKVAAKTVANTTKTDENATPAKHQHKAKIKATNNEEQPANAKETAKPEKTKKHHKAKKEAKSN